MEKKLIIFDCFGTLLKLESFKPYAIFLESIGLNIKDHYKRLMTEKNIDWYSFVDTNMITMETYQKAKEAFDYMLYADNLSVKSYLPDIQERLSKLRETHVVTLLSNLGQGYEYSIEELITPYIDKCFYSFEIGLMKPNVESYNFVKEWYVSNYGDIDNKDICLVDDKSKNIESAKSIGMQGIIVNNAHMDSHFSIQAVFELKTKVYC